MSKFKEQLDEKNVDIRESALDKYFQRLLQEDVTNGGFVETLFSDDLLDVGKKETDWTLLPFPVMRVDLNKAALAFPLLFLKSIIKIKDLNRHFSSNRFVMGVFNYKGKNVKLVDAESWLMGQVPEKKLSDNAHCILIHDSWGIYVPNVPNMKTLCPEEINWRQSPDNKPWLLGTILNEKCSLINGERLASLFDEYSHRTHT